MARNGGKVAEKSSKKPAAAKAPAAHGDSCCGDLLPAGKVPSALAWNVPMPLWDDAATKGMDELDLVVYRGNLLGKDTRVSNWKGGNISMKRTETDFDGRKIPVLRVKGSGSDLATMVRADLPGLRMEPIHDLAKRESLTDEEMLAYLTHCLTDLNSKRQSIETILHTFLPYPHIDHVHADAILQFGCADDGEALLARVFGAEKFAWVPYQRPGFSLSKAVSAAAKAKPKAEFVVLAKHGLICWGEDSKDSYLRTIRVLQKAGAAVAEQVAKVKVFGGAAVKPLPAEERAKVFEAVAPAVRGALSKVRPAVLHFDDSPDVLEYVNGKDSRKLSTIGSACPDHLVSTKRVPYFSAWTPAADTDALRNDLTAGAETFRADYEAYFRKFADGKEKMDDPYPRVICIPGVGLISAGKDKSMALAADWLFHRAIRAQKGASAQGTYVSLDEKETYRVEYWPLERYKLTQLPPDRELAGKVAFITGGASGIGKAIAEKYAAEGAHVVLADLNAEGAKAAAAEIAKKNGQGRAVGVAMNATSEESIVDAFRAAVREYGGVDIVVSCAGISIAAPIEQTTIEDWNKLHAILTTGYFLVAREAFRLWRQQGTGGNLIFIASKNSIVAGKNNVAYSATKAAELHMARCLAEEGGEHGIRCNVVNPDAVISGSSIWKSDWRAARAKDHGIRPEELEAYYRERTTLKVNIFVEDIAEAAFFFATKRSSKITGAFLNVDGGVPAAYPR